MRNLMQNKMHSHTLMLPKKEAQNIYPVAKIELLSKQDVTEHDGSVISEPSCSVIEKNDQLSEIQEFTNVEPTAAVEPSIDWLNELFCTQILLVEDGEKEREHHAGLHDTTWLTTLKLFKFHRKATVKANYNEENAIMGFEYVAEIALELKKQRGNKKPKSNENPLLPLTKLLLKDVPCKNSSTRYVRDGKYADCVLFAEIGGLTEEQFAAAYQEHGGRDGLAKHATNQHKASTGEQHSNLQLEEPTLASFLKLLSPQDEIGYFQTKANKENSCSLFALINPTESGENAVIPLPQSCISAINKAIFLILKKSKKQFKGTPKTKNITASKTDAGDNSPSILTQD